MRFKNKVIVVTGGARDIGKAIAVKMAAEGGIILVNYFNSAEAAEETKAEVQAAGGEVFMYRADITKAEEVDKLKEYCISTVGQKIDVLVNNAGGIVGRKKLVDQDEAYYDRVMDLNFKSLFLVTRAFVPLITSGGSIVNISSMAARDGGGGGASLYAASKGAITTYTRALAKELSSDHIRVNAVCPGLIDTAFHDRFTTNEVRHKVALATPLQREGSPEDVAHLVVFLASQEADFITGCNYDVNGGLGFS